MSNHEAKAQLSEAQDLPYCGEGEPAPRLPGILGTRQLEDSFFDPLPESELEDWKN